MNEEGKNGYFSTDSLILDVFDLLRALRKGIWLILLAGIIGGLLAILEPDYLFHRLIGRVLRRMLITEPILKEPHL